MHQDGPLNTLIKMLSSLPGLGNRSARRIALHLLSKRESIMLPLAQTLQTTAREIKTCRTCGNLDTQETCRLCLDARRDQSKICIVAGVSDLWAIERTGAYKGQYHILGGLLSALDGIGPQDLSIDQCINRVIETKPQEVILALSATVDGQSTAHFITDRLVGLPVDITHFAHGMPVGGELDYLDDGTITTALRSRK
ncbi:MAG: recombination mediator RecR [Bdellovibrionales bacterium]